MTNPTAILIADFRSAAEEIEARQRVADRYAAGLGDVARVPSIRKGVQALAEAQAQSAQTQAAHEQTARERDERRHADDRGDHTDEAQGPEAGAAARQRLRHALDHVVIGAVRQDQDFFARFFDVALGNGGENDGFASSGRKLVE